MCAFVLKLKSLWKRKSTEAVVAVILALTHPGHSFLIHHSELCSLRPHRWLTGEVFGCSNITHNIIKYQ